MKRLSLILLFLSWLAGFAWANQNDGLSHSQNTTKNTTPKITVLASDSRGITISCRISDYSVTENKRADKLYHVLELGKNGYTSEPGYPRLPIVGQMIGIPLEAKLSVQVLNTEYETFSGYYPEPAPTGVRQQPDLDDLINGIEQPIDQAVKFELIEDPIAYKQSRFYPATFYEVEPVGFIRQQRVARVTFQPIQYQASSGLFRFYKEIVLRINFEADPELIGHYISTSNEPESDTYESIFQQLLPNFHQAKSWRGKENNPERFSRQNAWSQLLDQIGPKYKIITDQEGMYKVTYQDLVDAGVDPEFLSADPRNFVLYNFGEEVAIQVIGEDDGLFDSRDFILFYAEAYISMYYGNNVYWLMLNDTPGQRMTAVDGDPAQGGLDVFTYRTVFRHEEKLKYKSGIPGIPHGRGHWFGYEMLSYGSLVGSYLVSTNLNHFDPAGSNPIFRGQFQGDTDMVDGDDHHLIISIDGSTLFDTTWDGADSHFITQDFDIALLSTQTDISFDAPLIPEIVGSRYYFDWFELEYSDSLYFI